MKPAPFSNVTYIDPTTKYQVKSVLNENNDGYQNDGKTEILDPQGKRVWEMPKFIGRHLIHLSPDGNVLILTGDFFFGFTLNVSGDEVMATVFNRGNESMRIVFSQLFTSSAKQIAEKKKFKVMGGGWASREDFVKDPAIDWQKRVMKFRLFDASVKQFSF